MPASIPFYCTPFFRRCKYFFQKNATFLKKFSKWQENKSKKPIESLPNQAKNRAQELTEGGAPQNRPENQCGGVTQTQVAPAHAEAETDPNGAHQGAKKQIAEESGTHRTEKIEAQSQHRSQQQTDAKAQSADGWLCHPQNRRFRGS